MNRKNIKIALSIITAFTLFLVLGTACTGILNADPVNGDENDSFTFAERLAERFDLDKDEVADFMEELREEKKAEMDERFEKKLDDLVEDGEITGAQKETILEKKEEMEGFKESLEDMKVSEAREALEEMKEELKDWAEENDLELKYLLPKTAGKGGPGGFNKFGFGWKR